MSKFKGIIKNISLTVLLIIIAIVLLIPRRHNEILTHENFISLDGYTSKTLYRDTKNIAVYDSVTQQPSYMDTIDDKNDMLLMKRCYQFADSTLNDVIDLLTSKKLVNNAVQQGVVYTNDFGTVSNNIIQSIQTAHDTFLNNGIASPIHGPVYVFIFQVPYYKNNLGEDISIQSFNVSTYQFQPYYVDPKNSLNSNPDHLIQYNYIICYGRYDKNGNIMDTDTFATKVLPDLDKKYVSYQNQCYINGAGIAQGPKVFAGCSSSSGTQSYTSPEQKYLTAKCLGPEKNDTLLTKAVDPNIRISTYPILYTMNTRCDAVSRFFFNPNNIQSPGPWQYITNQNMLAHLNKDGNAECLSYDGVKCAPANTLTPTQISSAQTTLAYSPLVCDANHHFSWCAPVTNSLKN